MKLIYVSLKRAAERELLKRADSIEFKEVKLHISDSLLKYLTSLLNMCQLFLTFKPNIVLVESPGVSAFPALLLCRILKLPYVVRMKGDIWKWHEETAHIKSWRKRAARHLNFWVAQITLNQASGILPIAPHIKEVIDEHTNVKQSRVVPISCDNDLTNLHFKGNCIESSNLTPLILTITNFNFWHKIKPLIEVAPQLHSLIKELNGKWRIVGGGIFLEQAKSSLRNNEEVFLGYVKGEKLAEFYQKAVCLLYISGADGLPNVILEAFLFKLPVVVNDFAPLRSLVQDGKTGLVIDLSDLKNVKKKLGKLLRNQAMRKRLGNNGWRYLHSKFSIDQVGNQLEEVLIQLYKKSNSKDKK